MRTYNYSGYDNSECLEHYGIKGMKWGVRRFKNKNGSLTSAGRKRREKILNDASQKAVRFAGYAAADKMRYEQSNDKRLAKISEKQYNRYTKLSERYSNLKVSDVNRKQLKEAQKFVEKSHFTNAEFADVWVDKGKRVINYEDYD